MTKEQIEADIETLTAQRNAAEARLWPKHDRAALDRAIARLRADLAKMEGPADGFMRVRVGVMVEPDGTWWIDLPGKYDVPSPFVVVADIPIPRVVEVEGVVEEVGS